MSQVRMRGGPVALDVSNGLQSEIGPEIENKLLGRGVRTTTPMVLRMDIVLAVAEIAALDAAAQSSCTSTTSARDDSASFNGPRGYQPIYFFHQAHRLLQGDDDLLVVEKVIER